MQPGATYGPYRILGLLGEGGMGSVFIAEHALVGRRAAIKVLRPELSERRGLVDRFFNEARVMASLNDPGVVQLFDFGYADDGSAYIVMELLEGQSLEQRLLDRGALPVADAIRIVRQAATTLASAHARGVVHRDLKPDNIFLVPDPEAVGGERAKLLDFGIAKLTADNPNRVVTQAGAFLGTPLYMSPEQCRGDVEVDHRSDVYSLGCVLFHLTTGRLVFERQGLGALITAHITERPQPPSAVAPGLPRELDTLVLGCLGKRPEDRFQSMVELRTACDSLLAKLVPGYATSRPGTSPAMTVVPSMRTATPTTLSSSVGQTGAAIERRRPRWIAVAAGFGAGLVVIAIVIATGVGSSGPARDLRVPEVTPAAPAGAAPVAATVVTTIDAGVVVAVDAEIAGSAAAGSAAVAPVAVTPTPVVPTRPVTKPTRPTRPTRPTTTRPTDEEMYEER